MGDDDLAGLHPDVAVNVRSLVRQIDRADEACLALVRQVLLDARMALTSAGIDHNDPAVSIVTVMCNIAAQQRQESIRRAGREAASEFEDYLRSETSDGDEKS